MKKETLFLSPWRNDLLFFENQIVHFTWSETASELRTLNRNKTTGNSVVFPSISSRFNLTILKKSKRMIHYVIQCHLLLNDGIVPDPIMMTQNVAFKTWRPLGCDTGVLLKLAEEENEGWRLTSGCSPPPSSGGRRKQQERRRDGGLNRSSFALWRCKESDAFMCSRGGSHSCRQYVWWSERSSLPMAEFNSRSYCTHRNSVCSSFHAGSIGGQICSSQSCLDKTSYVSIQAFLTKFLIKPGQSHMLLHIRGSAD